MDRLLKCFLANHRVKYSKKNLLNLACRRIYSYLWRINQAFLQRNHNYSSSINQKISNMKLSLRSFALGAAMTALGAMNAQEPVVTQKWFTQEGLPAEGNSTNYRNGNGVNGKIYIANAAEIIEIDGSAAAGSQSKVVYTHTSALNRGFTMDDAGNIAIQPTWPTSANNWTNWLLISNDFQTVKPVTVSAPTNSIYAGGRTDIVGRASGDFFGEGGIFYLTAQTQTFPVPVMFMDGEFTELEYGADVDMGAANNMAIAQPSMPFADMDDSNYHTAFYYTPANGGVIKYLDENGEIAEFPAIAEEELPAGWSNVGPANQNGMDVFTLGEHTYAVRARSYKAWQSNFIISDENGHVIFSTNYAPELGGDPENAGKTGNGCNLIARKVSDTKVELYQIYISGYAGQSFVAMYEITLPGEEPAKSLYIAGGVNGWDPANPLEFTLGEDGKYTYELAQTGTDGFKISTAKGTWDEFNAGVLGVNEDACLPGNTYTLVPGKDKNITVPTGNYTLTVDLEALTLDIQGEATFTAPDLYLLGDFNEWTASDAYKMTSNGEVNEDGNVIYTYSASAISGAYKIGSADWSVSLGAADANGAGTFELQRSGMDNNLKADLINATFTLTYPKDITKAPVLVVNGFRKGVRKAFAYEVKGAVVENDNYKVTFKATEAADEGDVVLKDAEGQTVANFPISNVVKGDNEVTFSISDLEDGKYTWLVRLISDRENETAGIIYEAPAEWQNSLNITGGVVFMRDAEYDSYGYMVVGHGMARGFAVFDPEGKLVGDKLYHQNFAGFTASNGSSTTRGDALRNYAVFADWSDHGSGYWRIDPLNPETEPVNMLMVEGATQAGDGTVTYNGVETGSGSCVVAFGGKGEDTKMFAYDEDIYENTVVRYDLGTADMITAAPTFVFESKGQFASQNVEVEALDNGYFYVSQGRADANDGNVPALMLFDPEGNKVWTSANLDLIPNTNAGFAITPDGTMAAFGRYNSMDIHVFAVSYDEYMEPTFTELYTFPTPESNTGRTRWCQMTFDAGNNLHVFDRRNGGYKVYELPYSGIATTPAKAEFAITKSSGIENVDVENSEAPVQYFNLQGVAVEADNLTPGIYVRRQGNKATKVVVK